MTRKLSPPRALRLAEHFRPQNIRIKLRAQTRDDVIEELTGLLGLDPRPRRLILETLLARESLGSTGIGKGIAIPHGRSVVVSRLMIACGRSEDGIEYDAPDGKPVQLFFLIAAPPTEVQNVYHPALARVVEIVREQRTRNLLLTVADAEAFWETLQKAEGE